ncbi:hypothetical protein SLA2020_180190 [Shorea laevis]
MGILVIQNKQTFSSAASYDLLSTQYYITTFLPPTQKPQRRRPTGEKRRLQESNHGGLIAKSQPLFFDTPCPLRLPSAVVPPPPPPSLWIATSKILAKLVY